jgi:hypothetical protein
MTVSLLSTIKTESRDRLYFDQWQYAFVFFVREAHMLRCRDVDQMRKQATMRQSWAHLRDQYAGNTVSNLVAVLTHINSIAEPFKLILSGNWITIYTNHANLADNFLANCDFVLPAQTRLKQAVVDRPRDTVLLLEPTYKLRSYFKSQQFPGSKIPALREFFAAQGNAIQPSPAMKRFLQETWRGNMNHNHWLPDHYYVDYDNPVYATMLALIMPRPFRKTMTIVQRINS